MKATGIVRKVDELGRVVLPKELRDVFNIQEGTPLEVYVGEEGQIILKKYKRGCTFCGSGDNLAQYLGENVCQTCKNNLVSLKSVD